MQTYTSIDDIWCEWGEAFTAIVKYLAANEPLPAKDNWTFKKGHVINQSDAYVVSATFSAYHPVIQSTVEITVWATVESSDQKITVKDSGKHPVADETNTPR